tara:strand:+ start:115 stop:348 length:234 start_codon:yes stop_codon:yes gene_type:complete
MKTAECVVCEKRFEFTGKVMFSPDFCAECQAVEYVNGRRFANTSFEELVRYCVELESDVKKLRDINKQQTKGQGGVT